MSLIYTNDKHGHSVPTTEKSHSSMSTHWCASITKSIAWWFDEVHYNDSRINTFFILLKHCDYFIALFVEVQKCCIECDGRSMANADGIVLNAQKRKKNGENNWLKYKIPCRHYILWVDSVFNGAKNLNCTWRQNGRHPLY